VALVPLVALAVLEGALRVGGYGYRTGFFEKFRVGQTDYLVNNEDFSLRFFPPQLARWPEALMIPARKASNTFRIFVLGESAARGEPEPPFSAARYLEALLEERFPGTKFEVVNVAITAINSHVILPIARDCSRCEGDLWIIYMGNNEMVGPFGAATVFGAKAPPLWAVRMNLSIQRGRVGQLLMELGRRFKGKPGNASWGGMKMFLGNQLYPNDPRKEVVYKSFQRNLQDIVRTGLDGGANILLSTVAVNLRDCAPFASLAATNSAPADQVAFERAFTNACRAMDQRQFATAAIEFEHAARLDPQFALLQFRWADCLLKLTNIAAAAEHFQLACDYDALPFRADSRINGAIEQTSRMFAGLRLALVGAAGALERESAGREDGGGEKETGAPAELLTQVDRSSRSIPLGQETFFEHVHFTFDGNYRLARAWAGEVERFLPPAVRRQARAGWATQEACERRLGLTDWNRGPVLESVIWRLHRPPLNGQFNNGERIARMQEQISQLRRRMSAATATEARAGFEAAIRGAPGDHWLHENFAGFLESVGDLKEATAQWRTASELLPRNCLAQLQLGRLLAQQGLRAEAELALNQAVKLRARLTEGWSELGEVHLAQGKFEAALEAFERARQLEPQDGTYPAYIGKALSKLNRRSEAIQAYRLAITLRPGAWEPHFALGDELAAGTRLSEAEAEYEEVVRLQPTNVMAHLNVGVMQARQGRFDSALGQFVEVLRLDPANQLAREYSARVQSWKNQNRTNMR
jgi:tetratricopeptide (TPR) repeat protein